MVAHAVTTTRKGGRVGPPLARAALLTIINMIAFIRSIRAPRPACVVMGSQRPPLRNPHRVGNASPKTDIPRDIEDAPEVALTSERKSEGEGRGEERKTRM